MAELRTDAGLAGACRRLWHRHTPSPIRAMRAPAAGAYHPPTMTWKANAYLAAALLVLFVLLNFIPTEDDLAMVLATAFIALVLVTTVSLTVAMIRTIRKR